MLNRLKNIPKFYFFLFGYHLLFTFFAYSTRVERGVSDSRLYWFQNNFPDTKTWFYFFNYGTDFLLFLNYPLVSLGFPYWSGFLFYSIIGYFGIVQWIRWTEIVFKATFVYKGIDFLTLLFLLPNLHYWTATLGKEPLIFYGIASVFYAIASSNYKTFSFVVGSLLVLIIRPHVALMLLIAVALVLLFRKNYSLTKRLFTASISFTVLLLLLYMAFQLSEIRYLDWDRIRYFNAYSILSLQNSGSYVPMLDYTYFYKLFSFYFRPLFFDSHSYWMVLASIENSIVLVLHLIALFFIVCFYTKMVFPQWLKVVFLFTFIAGLLYVQRYANLGLFMRTKIQFQPFLLVGLLYLIKQGFHLIQRKS